jgi:hypothetical protein
MRLASFNLENLFDRAKAFNQDTIADGKKVLDKFGGLNKVFARPTYSPAHKRAILDGLDDLGLLKDDNAGEFVRLRQNRGKLLKRPHGGPVEVAANGRDDWIGWLELKTERVNEIATQNTARVIRDVRADVLATIEVDNRVAVLRFNEHRRLTMSCCRPNSLTRSKTRRCSVSGAGRTATSLSISSR